MPGFALKGHAHPAGLDLLHRTAAFTGDPAIFDRISRPVQRSREPFGSDQAGEALRAVSPGCKFPVEAPSGEPDSMQLTVLSDPRLIFGS